MSEKFLFVALQGATPTAASELLVLARADLTVLNRYVFNLVTDAHSLWLAGDELYVVSTGTDEVVKLSLRESEVVSETCFWRPDPQGCRKDIHHLNAIFCWRGDLIVSGFGKKVGERWSLTRDGFLLNIARNEKLAAGIFHPHSFAAIEDELVFCESGTAAVHVLGGGRFETLPGYTRGLCYADERLFVGTSVGRRVSKSTGMINNSTAPGKAAGQCTVTCVSLQTLNVEDVIDMSALGDEIYDLLPVTNTESWPLASLESNRSPRSWEAAVARTVADVAAVVPHNQRFVFVDDEVLRPTIFADRATIPFLEKDGEYWGAPADDPSAITELERVRKLGVRFIIFAWPAFWWLDYYSGFAAHLNRYARRVLSSERVIAFEFPI